MTLFVSGATVVARRYADVGELVVPRARANPDTLRLAPGLWAMDNGAYSGFDAALFVRMLEDYHGRRGCTSSTASRTGRFISRPTARPGGVLPGRRQGCR